MIKIAVAVAGYSSIRCSLYSVAGVADAGAVEFRSSKTDSNPGLNEAGYTPESIFVAAAADPGAF